MDLAISHDPSFHVQIISAVSIFSIRSKIKVYNQCFNTSTAVPFCDRFEMHLKLNLGKG